jgi:hypothetical protein
MSASFATAAFSYVVFNDAVQWLRPIDTLTNGRFVGVVVVEAKLSRNKKAG